MFLDYWEFRYKAFDELEGIEAAWNQIKVSGFLSHPEELESLYSEVHLLKTPKHKNIIKFYSSWLIQRRSTSTLLLRFPSQKILSSFLPSVSVAGLILLHPKPEPEPDGTVQKMLMFWVLSLQRVQLRYHLCGISKSAHGFVTL
ncbi:putative non-specific serine/threonine protein kinase [Helianthus annuus]|nr:putative non-specific serine/threonine protein kinase [Helianthus annuus]